MRPAVFLAAVVWASVLCPSATAGYASSPAKPPAPPREFRGVWVATVKNIDWPSSAALTTEQQQAELRLILDKAVELKLNVVLFQVRPACDALYASTLEPWSEYLTGRMGRAPKPYYDPLAFAIEEAHQRGLELHAWFNPFRARHATGQSRVASTHISRTQPSLVRNYAGSQWLDPGEPDVQRHSLRVILDVVKRYNINGVHLDDYFYPYPEKDAKGAIMDFPDNASWKRYLKRGGKLNRQDWRRSNVDTFVQQLYAAIKQAKPAVKFGVSPFGIWRPGQPAPIKGFDAWASLYADSRKWLQKGWLDYFVPQLYWAIDAKEQSFPVLLDWWVAQNVKDRHLLTGISCYRHSAAELANQIGVTRRQSGADGHCLWSARVLVENRNGIATHLRNNVETQPALVPAFPWLDRQPPAAPKVAVENASGSAVKVSWEPLGAEPSWLWLLQTKTGALWTTAILPGRATSKVLAGKTPPDLIAVSSVDRCNNVGPATVVERDERHAGSAVTPFPQWSEPTWLCIVPR